jgi:hypothetical protein
MIDYVFLCGESCVDSFIRSVINKLKKEIRLLSIKYFVILMSILKSLVHVRSTFYCVKGLKVSENNKT